VNLSSAHDASRFGGKAANLAKAISWGVRVPAGFVLARDALALFLAEGGLSAGVRQLLDGYRLWDRTERKERYDALCSRGLASPIPASLQAEVGPLARALLASAPAGLAVRSSAPYEDAEATSFAGVFESSLCIPTLEALWEQVRRSWCSAWSPRFADYAARLGLTPDPQGMAVIVQQMVPADSAGVLFTADPLTGNPWRFVLNATFGLAQGLVAGSAPADRFVIAWDTGEVLERHIAEKARALAPGPLGIHEIELPDGRANAPAVTDEVIRQLAQLALGLDRALDRRIDIEWAMAGDECYLLQVRPITALPAYFPHELCAPDAALTWALSDPAWYHTPEEGVRLVAPLFRDRWASELWLRHQPSAEKALPRPVWRERDVNGYRYATTWEWGGPWQDHGRTERWLDEAEAGLRRNWLGTVQGMLQECERAAEAQRAARRAAELIPVSLQLYEREVDTNATVWAAPQSLGWICEDLLQHLLADFSPGVAIEDLLQGLPCYSYERTLAAQRLGREMPLPVKAVFSTYPLDQAIAHLLDHDPDQPFMRDYARFCFRFGMRPPTWPLRWARWTFAPSGEWGQDPTQALFAIRSSALGQGHDMLSVIEGCARRRRANEEELRERIARRAPAHLARMNKVLDWTQFWVPVLDDRKWHTAVRVRLADLLLQTGTMLVAEGLLQAPTDLLLLTPEDLWRIAGAHDPRTLRGLHLLRAQEYERLRRLKAPQYLGAAPAKPEDGNAPYQGTAAPQPLAAPAGTVLVGQGFSPGRVSGICRKAPRVSDLAFLDSLTAEHIILCPGAQTWDTDWLSLLMVARGLVTVQGSGLHHAVQIARECAVPFINLPGAELASIPDGARVTLDGEAGTVTVNE
jgi:pyruvate,water dikinase